MVLPLVLAGLRRFSGVAQYLAIPVALIVGYAGVKLEERLHREKQARDNRDRDLPWQAHHEVHPSSFDSIFPSMDATGFYDC